MLETSSLLALGLFAAAVFLLAIAVWMHVRVLGRVLAVERDHMRYQTAVEQLDIRITREVKARAGLARAESVEEDRSIREQSEAILAKQPAPVVPLVRPGLRSRR